MSVNVTSASSVATPPRIVASGGGSGTKRKRLVTVEPKAKAHSIGVIGSGNIGRAIVEGMLASGMRTERNFFFVVLFIFYFFLYSKSDSL